MAAMAACIKILDNQMASLKGIKRQKLPFILDGRTIFKCVTKKTTCSDVIDKLPRLQTPLAVIESIDGIERELTGKTKLLKVWRANGATRNVTFVIKRSQMSSKVNRSAQKLSPDIKGSKVSSVKSTSKKELSKDTLKQISDLAFYVRYQKTKLQALDKNNDIISDASEQNRLMRTMTSRASVNSMDAFLAKVNLNEIANFLTFCGNVATEKLSKGKEFAKMSKSATDDTKQTTEKSVSGSKNGKKVAQECLKSTKFGLKRKFASKKTVERTISTGTISSTDTGYHSVDSECENVCNTSATSIRNRNLPQTLQI